MHADNSRNLGFHLIEMLIVLLLIGILAAIALPSYSPYLVQEKRLEAKAALSTLSIAMERYFIEHNSYRDATFAQLHLTNIPAGRHYLLQIQHAEINSYVIAAIPQGNQAEKDIACGTLTLNSLGEKQISGTGTVNECW